MLPMNTLMSDDLFARFEEALQDIGLVESTVASQTDTALSMAEERAWMLHQQDPLAASGPFLVALKLKGDIQVDRLIQAIKLLYQADSNLNLMYHTNQDGALIKQHQDLKNIEIAVRAVKNDTEAEQILSDFLSIPINLSTTPAIQFKVLLKNNDETILGILGHHILLDDSAWQPIFSHLSAYYNQQEIQTTQSVAFGHKPIKDERTLAQYWQTQFENGLTRVEWPNLFKPSLSSINIQEYGRQNPSIKSPVTRVFTVIDGAELYALSEQAQCSLTHTMVSLFGLYIQSILKQDGVDLFVPVVEKYDVLALNQIGSSSNVIPVHITAPLENITTQIIQIRNQILQGISHNLAIEQILAATKTKRNAIPNILVTQFVDAAAYLHLNHLEISNLPIAPTHSDYDLTFAFQAKEQQQVQLELTTGHQLSGNIASWLLEQFIVFLQQLNMSEPEIFSKKINQKKLSSHQSKIAHIILDEFKAVLANPHLTLQDNFFDEGGHSILATRVIGKLQSQHQLKIKIADFFNAPTAIDLVHYVQTEEIQHVNTLNRFDPDQEIHAPITLLQKAFMGFSEQGRDPIFNIPFAFRFTEHVNEDAFYLAFKDILERHHALRSIFVFHTDEDISQTVIPMDELASYSWFDFSKAQKERSASEVLKHEANYSFDLTQEFPIRVRFLIDENNQHILSLLIYHIAMDEWSSGILVQELFQAYQARVSGVAPRWEKMPKQFHEYAVEQDDELLQAHLNYWIEAIGKVKKQPPLLNHDADEHTDDAAGSSVEFSLNATQTDQLYQLAKQYQSSIFYVVYAAIGLAVHFLGAGQKVLTGTSVACRENPNYQDTVGYFTNVVMHYTQFNEEMQIHDLVQQVQNNIFNTLTYADIPFAIVEEHIRAEGETSAESPYEVYIQLHAKNALTGSFDVQAGHQVGFELIEPERNSAKFGLHFEVYEEPLSDQNRLRIVINYRLNRYNTQKIELIKNTVSHVLNGFLAHADQPNCDVMQLRKYLAQGLNHVDE